MSAILQDMSAPALTAAMENNLYALFDTMIERLNGTADRTSAVTRYTTPGIVNPMFNGAMRVQTTADAIGQKIDETITFFQEQQAPFWFWWVGPSSQPANMGEQLMARGLLPYEVDVPGMAVDFARLNSTVRTPDNFHISTVTSEADLDIWIQTLIAGMEMPAFAAQSWKQASLQIGVDRLPWQMYIGWLDTEPVAMSMSFYGAGVVGIIAVGVVPEARRQGIGAAITLRPLLDGQEQGYRAGVLYSTEMGFPVYKRLGFERVCTISRYLWRS